MRKLASAIIQTHVSRKGEHSERYLSHHKRSFPAQRRRKLPWCSLYNGDLLQMTTALSNYA